ncbi:MAG: sensor domain-containing diguanylate cyclase [Pseudomonadota bacterium]
MNERLGLAADFPDIVGQISTLGIVVVDARFTVILWNRFMELNSNVAAEDVLGRNLFDIFPELNRNWLEKKIKSCAILRTPSFSSWRQRPYLFRFKAARNHTGAADFMHQDASIFPVRDRTGSSTGTCIAIHDVSELAEATRLLEQTMDQALVLEESNRRDDLTGLFNRKFFDEQITQEIVSARRYLWPLTLAFIDIDHFKVVNDSHGHPAGDTVLRHLAARLQSMLRSSDSLCRYGGEEFALILPHVDRDTGRVLMERLRAAIEAMTVETDAGVALSVTISVGISALEKGVTPGQLVGHADAALYVSKNDGRNRVTCFEALQTASDS